LQKESALGEYLTVQSKVKVLASTQFSSQRIWMPMEKRYLLGRWVIKALMALHLVAFLWKKNSTILIVVEPYLAYYPTSTYEGEILVCERFGVR
jgi:hypothetical protein